MATKGQGHFMTLVKSHWDFNIKMHISLRQKKKADWDYISYGASLV